MPEIELHLNFWLVQDALRRNFIDIGLLIKNPRALNSVCLHVPGDGNSCVSIVDKLSDQTTAKFVFNEDLSVTRDEKWVTLDFKRAGKTIKAYHLAEGIDVKEEKKVGQLYTIRLDGIADKVDSQLYFRLRLQGSFVESILTLDNRGLIPFESVHTSRRIIDLRVNQTRSIDASIKEFANNSLQTFSRIHFFLIAPSRDEHHSSSDPVDSARHLEQTVWPSYVNNAGLFRKGFYTVYHWKKVAAEDKEVDDLAIYVKFKTTKIGWKSALLYIAAALIISVTSNFLFDQGKARAIDYWYRGTQDENANSQCPPKP